MVHSQRISSGPVVYRVFLVLPGEYRVLATDSVCLAMTHPKRILAKRIVIIVIINNNIPNV